MIEPPKESLRSKIGFHKLPARAENIVLPFILSILMTLIISGVSTLRSVGLVPEFYSLWLGAWGLSWLVAFPTLLLVLPLVRKLTGLVVERD